MTIDLSRVFCTCVRAHLSERGEPAVLRNVSLIKRPQLRKPIMVILKFPHN